MQQGNPKVLDVRSVVMCGPRASTRVSAAASSLCNAIIIAIHHHQMNHYRQ
jgi:hypothetical protein